MKKLLYFTVILLFFTSCKKDDIDLGLEKTLWKLVLVENTTTHEQKNYPQELDDFIIDFKINGNLEMTHLCNYSFGTYIEGNEKAISFSFGPATEMLCEGGRSEWEELLVLNLLKAQRYTLSPEQLIIHCGENDLIFTLVSEADFCNFVSEQKYNSTRFFINRYLETLDKSNSDEQKINDLRDWLLKKNCVSKVEILCISCIKTLPPQSELRVTFATENQNKELAMDILMSEVPRFVGYHE